MTPLADLIRRRIAASGPISLSEYMADCLLHPEHGYYATRDPFGTAGDFITAPEISQMFGELIGLALAQSWLDQGSPAPFTLAELGPGRGTLMADILRAAGSVPGFGQAAEVHLVEASPVLRAAQAAALPGANPVWHDTADTLPDAPLFLVANEFFDALPVRQFERCGNGWAERLVALTGNTLSFGLAAPTPLQALAHRLADTGEGAVVELRQAAAPVVAALADRIAAHGGAALIIDYGDWRSLGDTFQALQKHQVVDPLAAPGQADLTAHVDFEALARAAARPGVAVSHMVPQGVFLEQLGITARAQALAARMTGPALDAHVSAHRRLTHPDEMGSLFKCLVITPTIAPAFPGLTP